MLCLLLLAYLAICGEKAILSACHVLNKIPLEKTPYEMWKGHAPTMNYLKLCGCLAKVGILDTQRVR